ncbi:hypothetical protein FACS1894202_08010 [Clostridia bacterium]|nr:hypothetical protein FACS1894202_08010 [Clostridia bacterium]
MKIRKIVIICVSIVLALALLLGALYGISVLGTSFGFEETRLRFLSYDADSGEYVMRDREGQTLSYMEKGGRAAVTYGPYMFFVADNLEGVNLELYRKIVKSKNFYDKFGVLLNFA